MKCIEKRKKLVKLNILIVFSLIVLNIECRQFLQDQSMRWQKLERIQAKLKNIDDMINQKNKQIEDSIIQQSFTQSLESIQNNLVFKNKMIYSKTKDQTKIDSSINYSFFHKKSSNFTLKNIKPALSQFKLQNMKQSSQQLLTVKEKCQIIHLNQSPQVNLHYHFISLPNYEFYIAFNGRDENKMYLQIYDSQCNFLSKLKQINLLYIFQQEKSTSSINSFNKDKSQGQHNLVYAINQKNQLISLDLTQIRNKGHQTLAQQRAQTENYISYNKFYRVLNNKVILPEEKIRIIGVIFKISSHQTNKQAKEGKYGGSTSGNYKEKQLIIAFDSGQIRIYDQLGTLKIAMKEPSSVNDLFQQTNDAQSLIESSDKSVQLVDHHPFPLLLQTNWIYYIDTSKYSKSVWGCPHIENAKKIFVESYHSAQIYVLATQRILKINIKGKDGKDNGRKGSCEIQKSIEYFDDKIEQKNPQQINFSVHKNVIFLDNLVYNMTSEQFLDVRTSQSILNNKNQKTQDMCTQFSLNYFPPQSSKPNKPLLQKQSSIVLKCYNQNFSNFHIYTLITMKSQSSLLTYIGIGFLLIVFFAVKFFKSGSSSYQKQLLYPLDLNGKNQDIRKQNYDQLKKYLQEAQRIEEQQNQNKLKSKKEKTNQKKQKRSDNKGENKDKEKSK